MGSSTSISNQEDVQNKVPKAGLVEAILIWDSLFPSMSGWQPWLSSHSLSPQGKVWSSPSFWSAWYSADENYFTPLCCLPLLYLFLPSIRRQSLRSGIMKMTPQLFYTPGATWVASCCLGQCPSANCALQGTAHFLQKHLYYFLYHRLHTALFSMWAIHSTEYYTPNLECLSPESPWLLITSPHPFSTSPWKGHHLSHHRLNFSLFSLLLYIFVARFLALV